MKVNSVTSNAPDTIIISWVISTRCNFKCSYCPPFLHDNTYFPVKLDAIVPFFKKYISDRPTFFDITGGEPTLWKELPEFIKRMNAKNLIFGINSNGSMPLSWWKNLISITGPQLRVNLSFHPEEGDSQHYLNIFRYLSVNCYAYGFIATPPGEYFDVSLALYNQILNENLDADYGLRILRPQLSPAATTSLDGYTKEQIKKIKYSGRPNSKSKLPAFCPTKVLINEKEISWSQTLVELSNNRFSGLQCLAGKNRIVVLQNGDVWGCFAMVGNKLGNIHTSQPLIIPDVLICDKATCCCKVDAMVTKFRPSEDLNI